MGIQSLLPFLAKSTRDAHISEFQNEFVAIDAYCWLHKGIYSCAFELATGKPTKKYVDYCMRYLEMLLHFDVKPILVFDGRPLFSKNETEKKRKEERKRKREQGKELLRAGKTIEGRKLLGESVDVTHELALNVMKECRKKNIDCIVASYEADAQLAFLSLNNIVKCVITEDSDLLAYGCEMVMFKMDTNGRGKLIEKSQIHLSLNMNPEEFNSDIFRYMCILSGCDYLPSLPSIGPAFALKFIKMLKNNDIYDTLPKLPIYVNKLNIKVTPEYVEGFRIADNTFKHQLVYNPFKRLQVPVRTVRNDDEIVGTKLTENLAYQLAIGNIDPQTMKKVDDFDPDKLGTGFNILWKTDSLPNATPRPEAVNTHLNETRKRQRKNSGSDTVTASGFTVQSITNDFKKLRTPLSNLSMKHFYADNATLKVPKSGFIFEPKILKEKKSAPELEDESKLLKSRYFAREKEKKPVGPQTEVVGDKRKDETYEDYLFRLYNEYFPKNENNDKNLNAKEKDCFCGSQGDNTVSESLCFLCKGCSKCCGCFNSVIESKSLCMNGCIKRIEEVKKIKRKSPQHFLLDEIYKDQSEKSKDKSLGREDEKKRDAKGEEVEKTSPSQSLSLNFSKILSRFDVLETVNSQIDIVEDKSDDIICDSQAPVRSSSPVFRIQKEARSLNKNFNFGDILDTAGTSASIYFPSSSTSLNTLIPKVLPGVTPLKSYKKTLLTKGVNSTPAKGKKSQLNRSSDVRTLFEYGFKKQCKSNDDPEA